MHDTVYLIVEPMAIIAGDLAMNVQDYDPSARIVLAETPQVAVQMLAGEANVHLALVHIDPARFAVSTLAQRLQSLGAQVVFFGNAAEENAGGMPVLQRPFTAQTTAELLKNLHAEKTS